jgi:dipeptidyl-peptidase-3
MEKNGVFPENTRLRKSTTPDGITVYELLQASVQQDEPDLDLFAADMKLRLIRGDHKQELEKICASLLRASQNVANPAQNQLLAELHDSFLTGNLNTYRSSQRIWVKDKAPRVETVLGFVEPYRDPLGVRAEFEGIVGIADTKETLVLRKLAEMGSRLIPRLPWAEGYYSKDGGKGPFEKDLFDPPDFASVHSERP